MDEKFVDMAGQLAESEVRAGIERARQVDALATTNGECADCGEPNLPARIALGYYRCIECQTQVEHKRATTGGRNNSRRWA